MNPDNLTNEIGNDCWDERIIVDVRAAATVCGLRLILNDFSYLRPPQYFLNISKPEAPDDPMGLHVGQPVKINVSIIDDALKIAAARGLDDDDTQRLIISHVLCFGEIESEMVRKLGVCPPEILGMFGRLRAVDERESIVEILPQIQNDIRGRNRQGL